MVTKPKLFDAYIAIDPTVSWNDGAEIVRAQQFFSEARDLQSDLYITAANTFGTATPGIQELVGALGKNAARGFRWKFEWMKDESHLSIPLPSIYSGLSTIFDGWYLADPLLLFDEGGLEAIRRHFREGATRYGYERTTPPFAISLVVAALIEKRRLEEASTVLLHDPEGNPPPWNQLDALARGYAERGNVEQAIRFCRLSLQENPHNAWVRQKLTEMGANPSALPKHELH